MPAASFQKTELQAMYMLHAPCSLLPAPCCLLHGPCSWPASNVFRWRGQSFFCPPLWYAAFQSFRWRKKPLCGQKLAPSSWPRKLKNQMKKKTKKPIWALSVLCGVNALDCRGLFGLRLRVRLRLWVRIPFGVLGTGGYWPWPVWQLAWVNSCEISAVRPSVLRWSPSANKCNCNCSSSNCAAQKASRKGQICQRIQQCYPRAEAPSVKLKVEWSIQLHWEQWGTGSLLKQGLRTR